MTLEFPAVPYPGHWKELGSNGIAIDKSRDCWVRDIEFINCDSGVFVGNSRNVSIENLIFNQYAGRGAIGGHHGVDFSGGASLCAAHNIRFNTKFHHELGVEHGAHHNVFSSCRGLDMELDHHHLNVHNNLWTDIDVGKGEDIRKNNARQARRKTTADKDKVSGSTRGEVYWNVRTQKPIVWPETMLDNPVVGLNTGSEIGLDGGGENGYRHETLAPGAVWPPNIWLAQRRARGLVVPN